MRVFDAWNREVRRRTNNGLSLRFYPGGIQGDEAEVIRKIRSGRLDGAAVTAVGLSQIHRPALVLQMPGIFRDYTTLDNTRTALNEQFSGSFRTSGFELMGWADVGRSRVFSQSPVPSPTELQPLRPWVWRDDLILPAMFSAGNVTAVPLQVPEVLTALQTNRVNAVITSPVACVSLQWSTRVTHMTDQPVSMVIGATVIGRTQFAALPPEMQTVLRETAAQFHQLARTNLRRDEATALTSLTQRGVTLVPVNDAQRGAWQALFTQTRTRLTGQVADAEFINRVATLGR